jgi:hypothetical protein
MQKLKREGDIRGNQDANISSLCSWEQEHSYKQQRKKMHFFVSAIPAFNLGTQQHEIFI